MRTSQSFGIHFTIRADKVRDGKAPVYACVTVNRKGCKLVLADLLKDTVISFLDWVQEVRKCSDTTRNVRLAALHCFCNYLQYKNPVSLHEWQRILSVCIHRRYVTPDSYYFTPL